MARPAGQKLTQHEFYSKIIVDEQAAVEFLKGHGIIATANQVCTKEKDGVPCISALKEVLRKGKPALRCTNWKCSTFQSIRKRNTFLSSIDSAGRAGHELQMWAILELVWLWSHRTPATTARKLTGRSNTTIANWYNLCRDVCEWKFGKRDPMGGMGSTVQIDESLFQGKRKYNRGRPLASEKSRKRRRREDRDNDDENDESDCENEPPSEPACPSGINYGDRVQGPWVFGLVWKETKERRFFIVKKRDAATLIPIICKEVAPGTTVMSDEWRAYCRLKNHGFDHLTVNHSEFFIDPETGAETQTIEALWRHVKINCGIKTYGADGLLERRLIEEWYRGLYDRDSFFNSFINDVKNFG